MLVPIALKASTVLAALPSQSWEWEAEDYGTDCEVRTNTADLVLATEIECKEGLLVDVRSVSIPDETPASAFAQEAVGEGAKAVREIRVATPSGNIIEGEALKKRGRLVVVWRNAQASMPQLLICSSKKRRWCANAASVALLPLAETQLEDRYIELQLRPAETGDDPTQSAQ